MNGLSYNINNGGKMKLVQEKHDDVVVIIKEFGDGELYIEDGIRPEDMVMLINLFRHIKSNDIQNDFINPNGRNKE